jgi:hypothetical protein
MASSRQGARGKEDGEGRSGRSGKRARVQKEMGVEGRKEGQVVCQKFAYERGEYHRPGMLWGGRGS